MRAIETVLKCLCFLLLAGHIAAMGFPARAAEPAPARPEARLMRSASAISADLAALETALLAWICTHDKSLGDCAVAPLYEILPAAAIQRRYAAVLGGKTAIAVYAGGVVVLPAEIDIFRHPEILLHELYHAIVDMKGVTHACTAEEERAAYELQIDFVDEVMAGAGIKPDPMFLITQQCSIHP